MKKLLLLMILAIISLTSVQASHIAGCDLSYTCISGNTYLIRLTFYRDCSGVSEPSSVSISCKSSCGNHTVTLNKVPPTNGIEVTPVCPGQATYCTNGNLYGLKQFIYEGQTNLPPCANWVLSYNLCCRNPSNTIQSPTSASMYIQATLNNLVAPCNSSPVFTNYPSTVICNGQTFTYNHGAIDPDGDSLVYSLVTPYDDGPGGGSPNVIYIGGYTPQQPLPSTPPVTLNTVTGDITMHPTAIITTVFAVLVQEWRRINNVPTLIGSVLRDMQLAVITCNNLLPTLGGINPNATSYNPNDTVFEVTICLGDTIAFNIYSQDLSVPPDNLNMAWNAGIPGATWNVLNNNTPSPIGQFFWIPNSGNVSNVPYCFTVTIKDDHCPYVGQQVFSYCITIHGMELDFNLPPDTTLCIGDTFTIHAYADTNCVNFYWTVDGNPATPVNDTTFFVNTTQLGPGLHTVMLTVDNGLLTNCPGTDYINVNVIPDPVIAISPPNPIVCNGQSISLIAMGADTYAWSPPDFLSATTGDTIFASPTQTTTYTVIGTTTEGCQGFTLFNVNVSSGPQITFNPPNPKICAGESVIITAHGGQTYDWSPSTGLYPITGPTVTATPLSTITYMVDATNNGCHSFTPIEVIVFPTPDVDFYADITEGCEDLLVKFFDNSSPDPVTWVWNFGDGTPSNLFTNIQNPEHTFTESGKYDVSLSVTSTDGCQGRLVISEMITVFRTPVANFSADPQQTWIMEPTIQFYDESLDADRWYWDFGELYWDGNHSNDPNPSHTYSDTGHFNVMLAITSSNGCVDTMMQTVYIAPLITFYIPNAFTPNNDGVNDMFNCYGVGINESTFTMRIYDRWGRQVYFSKDIHAGWSGKISNSEDIAPGGVYTYLLSFKDYKAKYHQYKGIVNLIR